MEKVTPTVSQDVQFGIICSTIEMCKRSASHVWFIVALALALMMAYLYYPGTFSNTGTEPRLIYDSETQRCRHFSPAYPSAGGIVILDFNV